MSVFLLVCLTSVSQQPQAFATLLYGHHEIVGFSRGVIALAETLRMVSKYPLVVMCADVPSQSIDRLIEYGCERFDEDSLPTTGEFGCFLKPVQPIPYTVPIETEKDRELAQNFQHSMTKLRAWQLPFQKVVFLDSDMLVMANCDELFGFPELSGVSDGNESREDGYLNSGMLVLEPSNRTFTDMMRVLSRHQATFRYPDQDFLNTFFSNRSNTIENMYNAQLGHGRPPQRLVKILHFFAHPKPWDYLTEDMITSHANETLNDITTFALQLASQNVRDIAWRLVADGIQPEFVKYPATYLIEAFSHWFALTIAVQKKMNQNTSKNIAVGTTANVFDILRQNPLRKAIFV